MELKKKPTKTKIQVIAKNPFRGSKQAWMDFGRSLDGLNQRIGTFVGEYDSYVKKMADFDNNKEKWERFIREKCYNKEWGKKRTMDLITEHFDLEEHERDWILHRIKKWRYERLGKDMGEEYPIKLKGELVGELGKRGEKKYIEYLQERDKPLINWDEYDKGFGGVVMDANRARAIAKKGRIEETRYILEEPYSNYKNPVRLEEAVKDSGYLKDRFFVTTDNMYTPKYLFKAIDELSEVDVFKNAYLEKYLRVKTENLDKVNLRYFLIKSPEKKDNPLYIYSPELDVGIVLAPRVTSGKPTLEKFRRKNKRREIILEGVEENEK